MVYIFKNKYNLTTFKYNFQNYAPHYKKKEFSQLYAHNIAKALLNKSSTDNLIKLNKLVQLITLYILPRNKNNHKRQIFHWTVLCQTLPSALPARRTVTVRNHSVGNNVSNISSKSETNSTDLDFRNSKFFQRARTHKRINVLICKVC